MSGKKNATNEEIGTFAKVLVEIALTIFGKNKQQK